MSDDPSTIDDAAEATQDALAAVASPKTCTITQFGHACEMLVALRLTLAGIPATLMPDGWPGYDLFAQRPEQKEPERISVKARYLSNYLTSYRSDVAGWDWIALVLLRETGAPAQFWILSYDVAVRISSPLRNGQRRLPLARLVKQWGEEKENFSLQRDDDPTA
jgi:hypothetical protein